VPIVGVPCTSMLTTGSIIPSRCAFLHGALWHLSPASTSLGLLAQTGPMAQITIWAVGHHCQGEFPTRLADVLRRTPMMRCAQCRSEFPPARRVLVPECPILSICRKGIGVKVRESRLILSTDTEHCRSLCLCLNFLPSRGVWRTMRHLLWQALTAGKRDNRRRLIEHPKGNDHPDDRYT